MFGEIAERLGSVRPRQSSSAGSGFGGLLIQITLLLVIAIFGINVYLHRPVVDSFLFALALAVGLTPELPRHREPHARPGRAADGRVRVIVRRLNSRTSAA